MKKAKATKPGTCVKCKKPYLRGERIFWTQPVHQSCLHGAFSSIPSPDRSKKRRRRSGWPC
jgi:hypothetical protein